MGKSKRKKMSKEEIIEKIKERAEFWIKNKKFAKEAIEEEMKSAEKFLRFYNETVIKGNSFDFEEFAGKWKLRDFFTKENDRDYLNKQQNRILKKLREIKIDDTKRLQDFYENNIHKEANHKVFFSKLLHTINPKQFPVVDNLILDEFGLKWEDQVMDTLDYVKECYDEYIKVNAKDFNDLKSIFEQCSNKEIIDFGEVKDYKIIDFLFLVRL